MRTIHLFAGAGGGLLADLILGHQPIAAVEWDAYCCRVLRERVSDGWFPGMRIHECDVRQFDASEYKGRVDCLHAGFPCQPFSVAGSRLGSADSRDQWPATLRIICEIQPRYVFLENVPGLVSWNGGERLADIVRSLAALGYVGSHGVLGADDVGACHVRKRWFLLANNSQFGRGKRRECEQSLQDIPNTNSLHDRHVDNGQPAHERTMEEKERLRKINWWIPEPKLDRVANGVANRVDRLKAIGNGQVPLQAALAFQILSGSF